MWYDGQLREVMASDTWRKYHNSRGFENLARVASLCNRAKWAQVAEDRPAPPLSKRKILGDASDTALLRCMETLVKGGADFFRKNYVKVNKPGRSPEDANADLTERVSRPSVATQPDGSCEISI